MIPRLGARKDGWSRIYTVVFARKGLFVVVCGAVSMAGCASSPGTLPGPPVTTGSLSTPADSEPATPKTDTIQIAAQVVPKSGPGPDTSAAGRPAAPAPADELYLDFDVTSVTLSDREKASLRQAVAARILAGGAATRIRISAGRGGSGNLFEQAKFGEKRARGVKELLPPQVVEAIEFDPTLPEDTVRLEFKKS